MVANPSDSASPLRICYLVAYFYPLESGAERQAFLQGTELVRRGHEVHVVTQSASHAVDLPRDECVEGIRIHRWIEPIRRGPLFGLTFVSSALRALRRLRRQFPFDVIHTHQALWESITAGLARKTIGAPTLLQPASSGFYGEAEELARTRGFALLRRFATANTAFAAISADIEREWLELGVSPDRLHRTASGVDTRRFFPPPEADRACRSGPPRAIFTGRLHPQKNLDVLIDAWREVAKRSEARLELLGDGPERARLERRIADAGLSGRIELPGRSEDPAERLRHADLFLLPSVAEGMSNSLLEAMATGLPCLVSRIGGNVDLIEHERSGFCLDPNDPSAWSAAVLRLLEEEPLRRSLGQTALETIRATYALPVVVDRYEALYRRILGRD